MTHYFSRLQKQIILNWDRDALCNYNGTGFTFGQIATQIEKLHILFSDLGINKGDRIAICARNQAQWGIAFLAVNTYGAVVVPILADFHPDSIAGILEHSGSIMLFTDSEIWNKLDKDKIASVKRVMQVSDFTPLSMADSDKATFDSLEQSFQAKYPDGFGKNDVSYPIDNDKELAVINYTSGSTGQPKGVMLRYECFSANIDYAHKRIPSTPNDTILSILPMAHMFGMVFELIYPLCGGSTVYYLGRTPSPTLLMQAMSKVKPFLVIAVPMIFEKIYKSKLLPMTKKPLVRIMMAIPGLNRIIYGKMRGALDQAFGGNVRTYIMGGAAVNPEVESFLHRIGLHFTIGYGMTEAAPLLTYEDWDKFKLRSCGKAMDYVSLRVDSSDPQHIPGEIQAKGINLLSGYFNNESATRAAFTSDGWFNTGDLGVIDADGNVFIKGRSKSMLLTSSGQNIYPEEIECIVNSQEFVSESVVVMRDDKLVALVSLDQDAIRKLGIKEDSIAAIVENIRTSANRQLSKYSQLSKIEVVTQPFEKTPKMSIKRYLYK